MHLISTYADLHVLMMCCFTETSLYQRWSWACGWFQQTQYQYWWERSSVGAARSCWQKMTMRNKWLQFDHYSVRSFFLHVCSLPLLPLTPHPKHTHEAGLWPQLGKKSSITGYKSSAVRVCIHYRVMQVRGWILTSSQLQRGVTEPQHVRTHSLTTSTHNHINTNTYYTFIFNLGFLKHFF